MDQIYRRRGRIEGRRKDRKERRGRRRRRGEEEEEETLQQPQQQVKEFNVVQYPAGQAGKQEGMVIYGFLPLWMLTDGRMWEAAVATCASKKVINCRLAYVIELALHRAGPHFRHRDFSAVRVPVLLC